MQHICTSFFADTMQHLQTLSLAQQRKEKIGSHLAHTILSFQNIYIKHIFSAKQCNLKKLYSFSLKMPRSKASAFTEVGD
jgi:hypothetical protein